MQKLLHVIYDVALFFPFFFVRVAVCLFIYAACSERKQPVFNPLLLLGVGHAVQAAGVVPVLRVPL